MDTNATTRRIALVAVSLTSFLTPFMSSSVNIALPGIGEQFHLSAVLLGWLSTAYSLAAAVFLVPVGKLADIFGRKRLYAIGVAVYTVASVLCAAAPSGDALLVARVIQGAGSAMIFGTGIAILTSVFPASERGKVMGINTAVVYAGLTAGPFLGGLLVGQLGWRSIFWINLPLGLVTLWFTLWKVEGEWAGSPGDRFDWVGSVIYGLAVVATMYGISLLPDVTGVWLIAAGIAVGAVFVWQARRAAQPVLDLRLFSGHRVFTFSMLAAFSNYAATASVTFLLSLYLQYIQGMSPGGAGAVLIAQPIVMAALSPLSGRLSDRVEPRIVASVGMSLTVVGLLMLTALSEVTRMGYIAACLLVLGAGLALFSSPNASAIMGGVERQHYGVASGMVGTMRLFGQMLSMGLAMMLLSIFVGRVEITPDRYGMFMTSMRTNLVISAALCVTGIAASLARGSVHQRREPSLQGSSAEGSH